MRYVCKFCFLALFNFLLVGVIAKENKNLPFNQKTALNSVVFEENKGQVLDQNLKIRRDVLFTGSSENMRFFITEKGISYQLYRNTYSPDQKRSIQIYRTDVEWVNACRNPVVVYGKTLPGYNHYYGTTQEEEPVMYVQQYESVRLKNIWNGVDIHFYSKEGHLESDWILEHADNYKNIRFAVKGAKVKVDNQGNLVFETPFGTIQEGKLKAYQNEELVECQWQVSENNVISFTLKNYDPELSLRIDPPVRVWGTYYGGTNGDEGAACASDPMGDVYLTGTTYSPNNIATVGAHQVTAPTTKAAFLVKFNASGVRLWGTYYGNKEKSYDCAVDPLGFVYMAGSAKSTTGIATPGSHQPNLTGIHNLDGFLVKFNPAGVRQWATYYGGLYEDEITGCKTDASGNVYVAGYTCSPSFIATSGTHKPFYFTMDTTLRDGFVAKFNNSGVRQWGTYYGANPTNDIINDLDLDASGNIYITGFTQSSTDIATPGTHLTNYHVNDAFLAKLNSTGNRIWGTYQGYNAGFDVAYTCAVDLSGNVYIGGYTEYCSDSISTPGAHQDSCEYVSYSSNSGLLTKFNGTTGLVMWSTIYGGDSLTVVYDCFVDNMNNIHIAGSTQSKNPGVIATPFAHQFTHGGGTGDDGFIAGFTSAGVRIYGTYYGGSDVQVPSDVIKGICMDNSGSYMYIAGTALAADNIASPGSHQPAKGSTLYTDAFIAKFCIDANMIRGKLFDDYNTNGIFDGTDVPITNFGIMTSLGGFALTNSTGDYEILSLPSTTHTIYPSAAIPHRTPVPTTHSAVFPATPTGIIDSGNDFALSTSPGIRDLVVTISSNPDIEPGKYRVYVITYKNVGTDTIPSGTIDFTHDNVMILGTTTPLPVSYVTSTVTWNYSALAPLETRTIKVTMFDPTTDVIGRVATSSALGNPVATDAVPADNSASINQTVVAPYDPNSKIVMPAGNLHPTTFISAGLPLDYIINFQNLGTDTADVVKVVDTLSSNLQIGTFEMIGASHPYTVSLSPTGVVTWMFYNIKLPHAAVNEPDSKGLIHYRIKPKSTLVIGDKIKNKAYIYFDYNPAIITNEVENEVNMTSSLAVNLPAQNNIKVYPNPNNGTFNLENAYGLVQITNVLGAVVWQNEVNTPLQSIDVKHLPKGVYVLHHKQNKVKLVIE